MSNKLKEMLPYLLLVCSLGALVFAPQGSLLFFIGLAMCLYFLKCKFV